MLLHLFDARTLTLTPCHLGARLEGILFSPLPCVAAHLGVWIWKHRWSRPLRAELRLGTSFLPELCISRWRVQWLKGIDFCICICRSRRSRGVARVSSFDGGAVQRWSHDTVQRGFDHFWHQLLTERSDRIIHIEQMDLKLCASVKIWSARKHQGKDGTQQLLNSTLRLMPNQWHKQGNYSLRRPLKLIIPQAFIEFIDMYEFIQAIIVHNNNIIFDQNLGF